MEAAERGAREAQAGGRRAARGAGAVRAAAHPRLRRVRAGRARRSHPLGRDRRRRGGELDGDLQQGSRQAVKEAGAGRGRSLAGAQDGEPGRGRALHNSRGVRCARVARARWAQLAGDGVGRGGVQPEDRGEAHALLRGVEADVAANGQYSGKPARDGGGRFVDAPTPQQKPLHADSCDPASHAEDGAPWGDAHLSMILSLQDDTRLVVYPFDKGGEKVLLTLNAGDIVIFRGDLIHSGAAYDTCNISLHLYIDSPRAPQQRDAKATYAVDAKGGAKSYWPMSVSML